VCKATPSVSEKYWRPIIHYLNRITLEMSKSSDRRGSLSFALIYVLFAMLFSNYSNTCSVHHYLNEFLPF